jgi:hypothetical protein
MMRLLVLLLVAWLLAAALLAQRTPAAIAAGAAAPIVEGDSLAVQMRPFLAPAHAYDAKPGRPLRTGVDRLLARDDLDGRTVLVSLGTADYLFGLSTPADMAHEARRLLRRAGCVVWKRIRAERGPWGDTGDGGAALNAGLERVKRLRLVDAVQPDAGDGLHFTPTAAAEQARRMERAARGCPS